MISTFKKFDVHVKAVEGVNQQTILGACITLLSTVLIVVLILSEVSNFMKIDVVSRMLADHSAGVESVKLQFDLQFFQVPCDKIDFGQEVTRGTLHLHEPGTIEKFVLDDGVTVGCHIRGSSVIDKVGGNFKFAIDQASIPQNMPAGNFQANISHRINHVTFASTSGGESAMTRIPDFSHSLQNQDTLVEQDSAIYHYAVQVRTGTICRFAFRF